jgi:polysaccharide export outer membrane protein
MGNDYEFQGEFRACPAEPVVRCAFAKRLLGVGVSVLKAGTLRRALVSIMLILLAGCIARSGPSENAITRQSTDLAGFTLIEMTAQEVANYRVQKLSDVGGTPGVPPAPPTSLSSGDVMKIHISETTGGSIFAPLASGGSGFDNVRVDYKGTISLPYVGRIKVAGLDPPQVEAAIRKRLEGIAVEPQVYVEIVADRGSSVLVSGEVRNPGRFSMLEGPLTLVDAIARAGGATLPPYQIDVVIRRGTSVRRIPLERVLNGNNQQLRAGDEVTLERDTKVFNALGALTKTGQIEFPKANPSLMDALAQAGGLLDTRADNSGVFVFRLHEPRAWRDADGRWREGPAVFQFNMSKPETIFIAQAFGVRNDDTIYVTNAPAVEWVRALEPIAITLATVRSSIGTQTALEGQLFSGN